MLMAATAKYTGLGSSVEWEGERLDRLGSYVYRRLGLAGDSSDSWDTAYLPALQPLGGLLLQCSRREQLLALRVWSTVAHDLAHRPASLRIAVTRQLRQLQQGAPHPLLQTCEQLEAAVHFRVLEYGLEVCKQWHADAAQPGQQQGTAEDRALAASALAVSSQRLLALDPDNPKPPVSRSSPAGWEGGAPCIQRNCEQHQTCMAAAVHPLPSPRLPCCASHGQPVLCSCGHPSLFCRSKSRRGSSGS